MDDDERQNFIGDLKIGEHKSQETVFRRTIDVSNPTDDVYRTSMTLSVNNGNNIQFLLWAIYTNKFKE